MRARLVDRGRLMELALADGRSYQAQCERMGLQRHALTDYVSGARDPSTASLVAMADYYGVTTDYILGRGGLE